MGIVERRMASVGMKAVRTMLPEIVNDLKEHPARVYEVLRYQESAAVILNRDTFDRLVEAAQESLDLQDAEDALTTEPLESFTDYHTRRMARGQSAGG